MGYMEKMILSNALIKAERTSLQRFLYEEMIRLNQLVDENLTKPQIFGLMSALTKKAKYAVNGTTEGERIDQLLAFLYQDQGFKCHPEEYFYTDNLLLQKVLRNRRGMPVSLGAVLLYLASVLDLPLYPVNFPTQFVVRAEFINEQGRKETRFINPWDGSPLSFERMGKWIEGELGFGAELHRQYLSVANQEDLLERLESVFKMALTREGKYPEALRLIEYRLMFEPEDPYEIRDRGMVLASMDCFQAAYDDLSYFIDQCPDDPSAKMLKLEMVGLEKQSRASVFH